jgi:putative transposase
MFEHSRHCLFQMHVHLVFVTKYRPEVFPKEVLGDLEGIFSGVCNDFEDELVEFDGEEDHGPFAWELPQESGGFRPRQ